MSRTGRNSQAHQLSREGKAVVYIEGGLHAGEVVGSQQEIEFVYEMVSSTDPEITRFLNDDIILAVLANPEGQELVANWYMRESDPQARTTNAVPRLWHKYVGHDDNRDSFMQNMPETTNINRVLFREWHPQIFYDHHQAGPAGSVVFIPPFRDPFNYNPIRSFRSKSNRSERLFTPGWSRRTRADPACARLRITRLGTTARSARMSTFTT